MINQASSESPKIICMGEALVDRLGPMGGDPLHDKPVEDYLGGAPANVACGLAKLGICTAFLGRLGDDEIGRNFLNLMVLRGINLDAIQIDSFRPTRIVLVKRTINGERSFQGFAGDKGEGFADEAIKLEELIPAWNLISNKANWIVLGTITLISNVSREAFLWTIKKSFQAGIRIALDINWRPTFWNKKNSPASGPDQYAKSLIQDILKYTSLIKTSKEEAIWFFNSFDPLEISNSLGNKPDVVVTDGGMPINWFVNGFVGTTLPDTEISVVDTTGAGDAFTAGLLSQLVLLNSQPNSFIEADKIMKFASICGALVCQSAGAIDPQPSIEQVQSILNSR